jgi:hypothetical protein
MSANPPPASNRRSFSRRKPKSKIKVACFKGSLDLGQNIALGLADISESGIRLVIKEELQRGQEVTLNVEGPEHRRPVRLKGRVVWSLAREEGQFQIGVQLDTYLKYADLVKMT